MVAVRGNIEIHIYGYNSVAIAHICAHICAELR